MKEKRLENKKIIITGASGGLGERFAWHAASQGAIPIMVARSYDKLAACRDRIFQAFQIRAYVYQADLSDERQLEQVFTAILEDHGQIECLINNAGFGLFEPVGLMEWPRTAEMFELNVFAAMRAVQMLLPHFTNQKQGHIVNVASQAGKIATPKSAAYSATKHALLGFTNVLRQEAKDAGIYVTAVNLGPVKTNFFDLADPEGGYVKNVERYMLDPDEVARKVIRSLFTKKREINMPWWMEAGSKMYQLFPGLMETVLKKQFRKK